MDEPTLKPPTVRQIVADLERDNSALRARIAALSAWSAAWKRATRATRTEWRREKVAAGYLLRRYSELYTDFSAAQERIATLEHECRNYRALIDTHEELKAEHKTRIAALEAALKPFEDYDLDAIAMFGDDVLVRAPKLTAGDIRRARRVLGES